MARPRAQPHLLLGLLLVVSTAFSSPNTRRIINTRAPPVVRDSYPASYRILPSAKSGGTSSGGSSSSSVNCQGNWGSGWSTCNVNTGQETRTYRHTVNKVGNGNACAHSHNYQETRNCDINCVGSWAGFTTCDATTGTQTRTYSISTDQQHSGTACSHADGATESQNCAVDCEIASGEWSNCVSSSRSRTWTVNVKAFNGGVACTALPNAPSDLTNTVGATGDETEACVAGDCAGAWSVYGTCQPSTLTQTRTFTITTPKVGTGEDCVVANGATQTQSCVPDVDCVGRWTSWGACHRQSGQQQRQYLVSIVQSGQGNSCPATHNEMQTQECPHATVNWDYFVKKTEWGTPLFQQHPLPNSTEMRLVICPLGTRVSIQWNNTEHSHDVFEMENADKYATCNFANALRLANNEQTGHVNIDCNGPTTRTMYYACSVGDACSKGFQRVRIHTTDPSKTKQLRMTQYVNNNVLRNHSSLAQVLEEHMIELTYNGHFIQTDAQAEDILLSLRSIVQQAPLSCSDWMLNPTIEECKAFAYTDMGFVERARPTPNFELAEEHYQRAILLQPTWCAAQGYRTQLLLALSNDPNNDKELKAQYQKACQVCVPSHGMETVQLEFAHRGIEIPLCKVVATDGPGFPNTKTPSSSSGGGGNIDESDELGPDESLSAGGVGGYSVKCLVVWLVVVVAAFLDARER